MDKEILKRYDSLSEGFKQVGGHAWEVYVRGIFVESLTYTILGVLIFCIAIIMAITSIKLFSKKVYKKTTSREIPTLIGGIKVVEDKPVRDKEKEEWNAIVATFLIIGMIIFIGGAFITLHHNIIGVFAPEYEAIRRVIETVKESS